jgi:hypothetical protein
MRSNLMSRYAAVLGGAALIVSAGCNVVPKRGGGCADGSCAARAAAEAAPTTDCRTGTCGQSTCMTCRKPELFAQLKEDWRNFDKEQLHPDKCWPDQYSRESRRRVRDPHYAHVVEGAKTEQTIWQDWFEKEKGREALLTEAGKHRLRYLARKRPYIQPQLYLETSYSPELDQRRVAAISQYVSTVSFEPTQWEVAMTNRVPTGQFGPEGPVALSKMFQPTQQIPQYEFQLKQGFYSGAGSGGGAISGAQQ